MSQLPLFSDVDSLKVKPIYFDQSMMKPPNKEYVCWLDVMGSGNTIGRSLALASNFVMKLHVASLQAAQNHPSVQLYPMIDGLYSTAVDSREMFPFLKEVFVRLAVTFVMEQNPLYKFIVRGGLSLGPVVKQADFEDCSIPLKQNSDYTKRILLGLPLSQAYDQEKVAPPYGLAMDDSVKAFGVIGATPIAGRFWKWWTWNTQDSDRALVSLIEQDLNRYYQWCTIHSPSIGYLPERIAVHKQLARDYFAEEKSWPRINLGIKELLMALNDFYLNLEQG